MPKDLNAFFYPKSIAVIGASRSPDKVGAIILRNIVESGFTGTLYPVNPSASEIKGLKAYPDANSLPENPDLAIVVIPAAQVGSVLGQLGEKGIKNVVVISAGFKEVGEEGKKMETDLIDICKKYAINLLGPNCLGFVNNLVPINATFGEPVNISGNLRFVSQSGAIASSLFDWCQTTGLGFSEFITLGNKAVLNENHILEYFNNQPQDAVTSLNQEGLSNVNPIGLYLESISSGCEFLNICQEITTKDPILVLKPGKTQAAVKAMQSHTGSIAGEDDVLEAVLHQAGAIRCQTLEDFFDYSRAFAWEDVPAGPRVAVISNAGGPAVISADAVVSEGLELAEFDEETKEQLSKVLPRMSTIINPIDVLGDALADRYAQAAEIILQKEQADSLIFILTPQMMTQVEKTAETIGDLSGKYKKPIFCAFIGGRLVAEGEEILNKYKIPSFRFPERAISAVGCMWKFKQQQIRRAEKEEPAKEISIHPEEGIIRPAVQRAVNEGYRAMDNISANNIVSSVGIQTPPTRIAENLDQAKQFADKEGWPVVLKLSSPGLLHKKEVGGVITDIINEKQLDDAWHKIERKVEQLDEEIRKQVKFQVQKDVVNGVEVIVGVKEDPTFGLVMLFGAGGTYAELIADRNLHLLPVNTNQARKLVEGSKVYDTLKGTEQEPPQALEMLYETMVRLGKLATIVPEASDIEINPAIVTLNNVWAVDSKIVMKEAPKKLASAPKLQVATTLEHTDPAKQFHYYRFEAEQDLNFKPGQYISVKVAPNAVRAYSISDHDGPRKFSLLVDTRPGGPGSKFFESLKPGDKMTYMGPFGMFTLNLDDGAEHLLFMSTGSGTSAVRCMIDAALMEYKVTKPITLYFGLMHDDEIFWDDHFDELAAKYPNFNYEIAIDEPSDSWKGAKGFITELARKNFADASKCAAYLCGHRAMIADATDLLLENGCPQDRIYKERFV